MLTMLILSDNVGEKILEQILALIFKTALKFKLKKFSFCKGKSSTKVMIYAEKT